MTPPAESVPVAPRHPGSRVLLAVTAGFAVAALCLGLQLLKLRAEKVALAAERDLAEAACRIAQTELKERSLIAEGMINELGRLLRAKEDISHFKVAALTPPAAPDGATGAIAVWDPAQQAGLLVGDKLPANAPDLAYRIWMFDPAGEAVNCGTFRVSSDPRFVVAFRPERPVIGSATFEVCVDRAGAATASRGPAILAGRMSFSP